MYLYFSALQNYAIFHTRSRRREFFTFLGYHLVFVTLTILLDVFILGVGVGNITSFSSLYLLGTFLPMLAITVRRLHDTGKTGMWISIGLIPILGWICLFCFFCQKSQKQVNEWGICPRRTRHH